MAPTLEDVMERLSDIEREVRLLRQAERPIPPGRLYTREQAGFRIVHGQDPGRVPEGEEKACMEAEALSQTWVDRRLSDDDCLLSRTRIGGKVFVSKRNVRHFLKARRASA